MSLGSWMYYWMTELRPGNVFAVNNSTPFVWAFFFTGIRVVVALIVTNKLMRAAWLLGATTMLAAWITPIGGSGLSAWWTREVLSIAFAGLLFVGGWVATPSKIFRVIALVLLVFMIPIRYLLMKQVDDATGRTTIMTQGLRWPPIEQQPNKPLQPMSGATCRHTEC